MAVLRFSNVEFLSLPDCNWLLENGKCRRLSTPKCNGEECPYYKKKSSFFKAQERLCSLDEQTQERIAKKYYSGFRPWAGSGTASRR